MSQTKNLLPAIIQILLPHFDDENRRRALFNLAFYDAPHVYNKITFVGDAETFTANSTVKLLDVEVESGQCALIPLLEALKAWLNPNQHAEVDTLVRQIPELQAARRAKQNQLNTPADHRAPTQHDDLPAPRIIHVPGWVVWPLRTVAIVSFVATVVLATVWVLSPNAPVYEPLIVLLGVVSAAAGTGAAWVGSVETSGTDDVPVWLRVTVISLALLLGGVGVALTVVWAARPDAPLEPWIVLCLTLSGALFTASSSGVLGYGVRRLRRLPPEERVLRELESGWIEGFLRAALREVKEFGIKLTDDRQRVVNHRDYGDFILEHDADILNVFHALDGQMLILGRPGAGKTIMLLQLADALMQSARKAIAAEQTPQMPLVFNLSSWARSATPTPLKQWVVSESRQSYNAKPGWIQTWLDNDDAILLLDGLDEIKAKWRDAHVTAINAFRAEYPHARIVVSSRIKDYDELTTQLDMKGAVRLSDLDRDEVLTYLSAEANLTELRRLAGDDAVVAEMVTTPFLLNTMAYTYADDKVPDPQTLRGYNTPAERRQHLFQRYVDRRLDDLRRRDKRFRYTNKQVRAYLEYLATKMQISNVTAFKMSDINGNWLRSEPRLHRAHQWILRTVAFVPPVMLAFALGWVRGGVIPALGLTLIVGAAAGAFVLWWMKDAIIENAAKVGIPTWQATRENLTSLDAGNWLNLALLLILPGTVSTLLMTLLTAYLGAWWALAALIGLIALVIGVLALLPRFNIGKDKWWVGGFGITVPALIISATFTHLLPTWWLPALTAGTLSPLLFLVVWNVYETMDYDNEMWRVASPRFGGLALLVGLLPFALLALAFRSQDWLILGGLVGTVLWVAYGGLLALDTALTRLYILTRGYVPLRPGTLFGHMIRANVLRRRSGGYQFIHRYLLESFAGDDEIQVLVDALRDDARRDAAYEQLVNLGDRGFEALISALADADALVRESAAGALGKIGDERAVGPLIGALSDADEKGRVRRDAAQALGRIGDERAVEPLIGALSDAGGYVRRRAAWALGEIGDARAVEPLIGALSDAEEAVRYRAALALGRIRDERAVGPLIGALSDADWDVRWHAVEALVKIGELAVAPLIGALSDKHEWVRISAAGALGKTGDARAVEPLIGALADANGDVRSDAAWALGHIGDERAVEPLIAALKDDYKDWRGYYVVREAAAGALRRINTPAARQALIDHGYDPDAPD